MQGALVIAGFMLIALVIDSQQAARQEQNWMKHRRTKRASEVVKSIQELSSQERYKAFKNYLISHGSRSINQPLATQGTDDQLRKHMERIKDKSIKDIIKKKLGRPKFSRLFNISKVISNEDDINNTTRFINYSMLLKNITVASSKNNNRQKRELPNYSRLINNNKEISRKDNFKKKTGFPRYSMFFKNSMGISSKYELLKRNLIDYVARKLHDVAMNGAKYDQCKAHTIQKDILVEATSPYAKPLGIIVDANLIDRLVNEVLSSDEVKREYNMIIDNGTASKPERFVKIKEEKHSKYELLKKMLIDDVSHKLHSLTKNGSKYNQREARKIQKDIFLKAITIRAHLLRIIVTANLIERLANEVLSSENVQKEYKMIIDHGRKSQAIREGTVKIIQVKSSKYELLKKMLIDDVSHELHILTKKGSKYNQKEARKIQKDILLKAITIRAHLLRIIVTANLIERLANEVLSSENVKKEYKMIIDNGRETKAVREGNVKIIQDTSSKEQNEKKRIFPKKPLKMIKNNPEMSSKEQNGKKRIFPEKPLRMIKNNPEMSSKYNSLKKNLMDDVSRKLHGLAKKGTKYNPREAHTIQRDILLEVMDQYAKPLGLVMDENLFDRLVNEVLSSENVKKEYNMIIDHGKPTLKNLN